MAASGPSRGHARLRVGESTKPSLRMWQQVSLKFPSSSSSLLSSAARAGTERKNMAEKRPSKRCGPSWDEEETWVFFSFPRGLKYTHAPSSSFSDSFARSAHLRLFVRRPSGRTRLASFLIEPARPSEAATSDCEVGRASERIWGSAAAAPVFLKKYFFIRPQIGRDYPLNLSI